MAVDRDAMGLDKRRSVIGGGYGPSVAKQLAAYGAFLAVLAVLVAGLALAARELDQPPERQPSTAPWASPEAQPLPPRRLDFPRNGPTEVD